MDEDAEEEIVYTVPDKIVFKNYSELKSGNPHTRKLLVRISDDVVPSRRKIQLVLPAGAHFEIKDRAQDEVVEMEAGGTLPLTVIFRKPENPPTNAADEPANLQDWLCIRDKIAKTARRVPLRAIFRGDTCDEGSYYPQSAPHLRSDPAARPASAGEDSQQTSELILLDDEHGGMEVPGITPFRCKATGAHGQSESAWDRGGGAAESAAEEGEEEGGGGGVGVWDVGAAVDPVRLLMEADDLLNECNEPLTCKVWLSCVCRCFNPACLAARH